MFLFYSLLSILWSVVSSGEQCSDKSPYCNLNDCAVRPGYALEYCRRTCGDCGDFCQNSIYVSCKVERKTECDDMLKDYCPILCGLCSTKESQNATTKVIIEKKKKKDKVKVKNSKYTVFDKDLSNLDTTPGKATMKPTPETYVVRKGPEKSSGQTTPIYRSKEVELNTKIAFLPDHLPSSKTKFGKTTKNSKKTKSSKKSGKKPTTGTVSQEPSTSPITSDSTAASVQDALRQSMMRYAMPERTSVSPTSETMTTTPPLTTVAKNREKLSRLQNEDDFPSDGVEIDFGPLSTAVPEARVYVNSETQKEKGRYSSNAITRMDIGDPVDYADFRPKTIESTPVKKQLRQMNPYFVHTSNRIGGDPQFLNGDNLNDAYQEPYEPSYRLSLPMSSAKQFGSNRRYLQKEIEDEHHNSEMNLIGIDDAISYKLRPGSVLTLPAATYKVHGSNMNNEQASIPEIRVITIPNPQQLTIHSVDHSLLEKESEPSTTTPPHPTIIPISSDEDDSFEHIHVPEQPSDSQPPPRIITVTLPAGTLDNNNKRTKEEFTFSWTESPPSQNRGASAQEQQNPSQPQGSFNNYADIFTSPAVQRSILTHESNDRHDQTSDSYKPYTSRYTQKFSPLAPGTERFQPQTTELPTMPPTFTPSTVIEATDNYPHRENYVQQGGDVSNPSSGYIVHNPFMVGFGYGASGHGTNRGKQNRVNTNYNRLGSGYGRNNGQRTTYKPVRGGFIEAATGSAGIGYSSHGFPKMAGTESRYAGEDYTHGRGSPTLHGGHPTDLNEGEISDFTPEKEGKVRRKPSSQGMNSWMENPLSTQHHAPEFQEQYFGSSQQEVNQIPNPLGLTDLITLLGCRDRDPATCNKISEETCLARPGFYLKLCPVKCKNCNGLLCYDSVKIDCNEVKQRGGCKLPSAQEYCPRTCQLCPNTPSFIDSLSPCKDELETCEHLAKTGVCEHPYSQQALRMYCAKSCGFCKESMFYLNDISTSDKKKYNKKPSRGKSQQRKDNN